MTDNREGQVLTLCLALIDISADFEEKGCSKSESLSLAARVIAWCIYDVADVLAKNHERT